jgi:hypothetical protein
LFAVGRSMLRPYLGTTPTKGPGAELAWAFYFSLPFGQLSICVAPSEWNRSRPNKVVTKANKIQ